MCRVPQKVLKFFFFLHIFYFIQKIKIQRGKRKFHKDQTKLGKNIFKKMNSNDKTQKHILSPLGEHWQTYCIATIIAFSPGKTAPKKFLFYILQRTCSVYKLCSSDSNPILKWIVSAINYGWLIQNGISQILHEFSVLQSSPCMNQKYSVLLIFIWNIIFQFS